MLDLFSRPRPSNQAVGWRNDIAVTNGQFDVRLHTWCAFLRTAPGTRFALFFNDSIEFAAALFGAWHAGKIIYLPSDTLPSTCAALRTAVDGYLGEFPEHCMPAEPAKGIHGTPEVLHPLDASFDGLVVYTSGSTGTPQSIPKKLSQLAAEVATLQHLFGNAAGCADTVATVSHQHIYGLLFKVLWPLAAGRAIHARSVTYPEELAQKTSKRDCILISSPAHLKRLPESPAWMEAAHRVRIAFSSGGPLPLEVARVTETVLGHAPVEVYGSSETGGIGWRQRNAGADEEWSAMPGVETRIAAEGEILEVRSPHLPDSEWFRTSDRARLFDGNRFAICGRVDRIVKIEEKRISLDRIEARLLGSHLVREARVLVVDGHRQRVAAFIVLSDAGRALLRESGKHALNCRLRDELTDTIERIALPRLWRYPDALPINAQGKTTQAALLALLNEISPSTRTVLPRKHLLQKEPLRVVYELAAPRDLVYFDGHFPQAPILPGVVQVDWALKIARDCFDLPPAFRGIHALKFQRVIQPETAFSLELLHDPAKNSVTFKFFSSGGVHANGRLMFGAADV